MIISVIPHDYLGALRNPMFRKRYELFVEGRGWSNLKRPDRLDIDAYDDARTTYIVAMIDGDIVGGARLRPTVVPHMLQEDFAWLCRDGKPPTGPDVFECSRTFVERRHRQRRSIFGKILLAAAEFCVENRVTTLTGVLEPWWLNSYLAFGLEAAPLGLTREFEGMELLAVAFSVNEQIRDNLRKRMES